MLLRGGDGRRLRLLHRRSAVRRFRKRRLPPPRGLPLHRPRLGFRTDGRIRRARPGLPAPDRRAGRRDDRRHGLLRGRRAALAGPDAPASRRGAHDQRLRRRRRSPERDRRSERRRHAPRRGRHLLGHRRLRQGARHRVRRRPRHDDHPWHGLDPRRHAFDLDDAAGLHARRLHGRGRHLDGPALRRRRRPRRHGLQLRHPRQLRLHGRRRGAGLRDALRHLQQHGHHLGRRRVRLVARHLPRRPQLREREPRRLRHHGLRRRRAVRGPKRVRRRRHRVLRRELLHDHAQHLNHLRGRRNVRRPRQHLPRGQYGRPRRAALPERRPLPGASELHLRHQPRLPRRRRLRERGRGRLPRRSRQRRLPPQGDLRLRRGRRSDGRRPPHRDRPRRQPALARLHAGHRLLRDGARRARRRAGRRGRHRPLRRRGRRGRRALVGRHARRRVVHRPSRHHGPLRRRDARRHRPDPEGLVRRHHRRGLRGLLLLGRGALLRGRRPGGRSRPGQLGYGARHHHALPSGRPHARNLLDQPHGSGRHAPLHVDGRDALVALGLRLHDLRIAADDRPQCRHRLRLRRERPACPKALHAQHRPQSRAARPRKALRGRAVFRQLPHPQLRRAPPLRRPSRSRPTSTAAAAPSRRRTARARTSTARSTVMATSSPTT